VRTNTNEFLKLTTELRSKLTRLDEIRTRARNENRDLSRREAAEVSEIKASAEAISARLPIVDGRLTQGDARFPGDREPDRLKPEERVADWVRENGHVRSGGYDEPDRLSFGRMVRGAVTGSWEGAEAEQRALSEGTLAAGGYLLGPALSSTVIDRVRNQMRTMQAGATTVPLTAETTYMARLASGSTPVSWKVENNTIADSSMTFERIVFNAQTLPVLVKLSVELFEDLSPEATNTIEHEISLALSLELDRACLRGSGITPEPQGILNQTGVTLTSLGANGAPVSGWDTLTDAVSVVRGLNIEPSAILWASRTQQSHDKLKDSTGQSLRPAPSIDPIPRLSTNQIPTNLSVGGSGAVCSEIYVGRWSDLLVGIRTDMRFQVRALTERFADNMQVGLLCYLRADVQLAHPGSFNVVTGIKP
jgi:HK97 family phage major capsid protein